MSCTPECAAILASHDKERRRALAERDEAVAENQRLRQGLWDSWAALGGDTDGDTGPGAWIAGTGVDGFIAAVIRDAAQWRKQSEDDYDADTSALEAEIRRLTAGVE